jgi:hypothetical protein
MARPHPDAHAGTPQHPPHGGDAAAAGQAGAVPALGSHLLPGANIEVGRLASLRSCAAHAGCRAQSTSSCPLAAGS